MSLFVPMCHFIASFSFHAKTDLALYGITVSKQICILAQKQNVCKHRIKESHYFVTLFSESFYFTKRITYQCVI
jgi:hypothetical protein